MNADVKKLWIDALRSGEKKQGVRALCKNDKYCCMGILCEIAREQGIVNTKIITGDVYYVATPEFIDSHQDKKLTGMDLEQTNYLLAPVLEWSGLSHRDPVVFWGDQFVSLASLNDDKELSFQQIADLIEDQL